MRLSSLLLLGLCLAACPDNGGEAYAKADARYRELVLAQRHPMHADYDEVLANLEKVPSSGPFAEKAEKLRAAVLGARTRPPPLPMATTGHGGPSGIESLKDACAE